LDVNVRFDNQRARAHERGRERGREGARGRTGERERQRSREREAGRLVAPNFRHPARSSEDPWLEERMRGGGGRETERAREREKEEGTGTVQPQSDVGGDEWIPAWRTASVPSCITERKRDRIQKTNGSKVMNRRL
jgi:hypothetical protein